MVAVERMRTIDDPTPLNGDVIDVAARIAWTVRMVRLSARSGVDARLRTLADQLGSSPAHLSRVETGQRRDGAVYNGYERALGLPTGSLRAPIDMLCRTFPAASPKELDPGIVVTDVAAMSDMTERLLSAPSLDGGQWLTWSAAMGQPGNIGLPAPVVRDLTRRLAGELIRAVGAGYPTRYEALTRLRCSAYGEIVFEVIREMVDDPHAVGVVDLASAASECNSESVVEWGLDLMRRDDPTLVVAGGIALENLGSICGRDFWMRIAPDLLEAFDGSEPGSMRAQRSAHVVRLVPGSVWQELGLRPARRLPPAPQVASWSREAENDMWQACVDGAQRMVADLDLPDQPMLARFLFDIAFGPWETRFATAAMLLTALPGIGRQLSDEMVRLMGCVSDPQLQARVAWRLGELRDGHPLSRAPEWLISADPDRVAAALNASGAAGEHVSVSVLTRAVHHPQLVRAAIQSAGLSGHPILEKWAGDEDMADDVRAAARWWIDSGQRIIS